MSGITINHEEGSVGSGQTKLTLTDGLVAASVQFKVVDGSALLPSITNSGDENTGLFFPNDEEVAFTGNGQEVLRLNGLTQVMTVPAQIIPQTGKNIGFYADQGALTMDLPFVNVGSNALIVDKANQTVRISNAYTLPNTSGSSGQVITSNGSGGTTWTTPASGGGGGGSSGLTQDDAILMALIFGS